MKAMLDIQACDILMTDLQRMGSISKMRKVAALSVSYGIPISTHFFTEQSLCIAGSAANYFPVEHMPLFEKLFNESMKMVKGYLLIPERPGIGFTFNQDAIAKLRQSNNQEITVFII